MKLIFFKWNLKVNGRENDFYLEYIMLKIRCGNLKYFVLSVWEMGKMKYVKSIIWNYVILCSVVLKLLFIIKV